MYRDELYQTIEDYISSAVPTLEDANYNEEHLALFQSAFSKTQEYYSWLTEKEWKTSKEKNGVIVKTEAMMPCGIKDAAEVIMSDETEMSLDDNMQEITTLEDIHTPETCSCVHSVVQYRKTKNSFFFKSRDFVNFVTCIPLSDECYLFVTFPIDHACDPMKGKVRGYSEGLFIFEQIGEEETNVKMISKTILGGSIPKSILKSFSSDGYEEMRAYQRIITDGS
ncbi:unnamed protein product [Moneuplotes crassus]|uniref:START domain-containing protein n=1 Tax=Euplotes crassus TaxID=5936 RepID=A0AAD1XVF6_EUPCR|nr:unnamed protein product [Moneuplotes crassus]